MGRYYEGNISGKFWVVVQDTECMTNYGANSVGLEIRYASCGCILDGCFVDGCFVDDKFDDIEDGTFCENCFDSREEHLKEIQEEADDEATMMTIEKGDAIYQIDRDTFEEQGKPFIEKHAELFIKAVKDFKMSDEGGYEYECYLTSPVSTENKGILADVCMLKQIEKFFEDNPDEESCSWTAYS
jgi:hypothetical protein